MRKACLVTVGRFSLHLVEAPKTRPEFHLHVDGELAGMFGADESEAIWHLPESLTEDDLPAYRLMCDIIDEHLSGSLDVFLFFLGFSYPEREKMLCHRKEVKS